MVSIKQAVREILHETKQHMTIPEIKREMIKRGYGIRMETSISAAIRTVRADEDERVETIYGIQWAPEGRLMRIKEIVEREPVVGKKYYKYKMEMIDEKGRTVHYNRCNKKWWVEKNNEYMGQW